MYSHEGIQIKRGQFVGQFAISGGIDFGKLLQGSNSVFKSRPVTTVTSHVVVRISATEDHQKSCICELLEIADRVKCYVRCAWDNQSSIGGAIRTQSSVFNLGFREVEIFRREIIEAVTCIKLAIWYRVSCGNCHAPFLMRSVNFPTGVAKEKSVADCLL
jgi:hypothetical protein